MKYADFEQLMSQPRMNRYLAAVGNDKRRAMTLYRKNLKLSQELFGVVSYFEIALRNAINDHYVMTLGNDWLRDGAFAGGRFDNNRNRFTKSVIMDAYNDLGPIYTHPRLVAKLGFGFWRFMFSRHQFRACGQTLISIFPNRPASSPAMQYNANYIFNELKKINDLRNRIAHHDQICFRSGASIIDTSYATNHYNDIITLFGWLNIDSGSYLFGIDKVQSVINEINSF